jgi:hypothetical protein
VAYSNSYNDLSNKPSFHAVATSGDYNSLINKPIIQVNTHIGAMDLTLSGNRVLNSAGFSFEFKGNAPVFHLNSTEANTTPTLRLTRNNGGSGNVYEITQSSNQVSHSINNTVANHAFLGGSTLFGYIGNAGLSASSQVSNYPAFNFIGALQTGINGTTNQLEFWVNGVRRGLLDINNDLYIGTGNNGEFYASNYYRVWNGSASEQYRVFGYGSQGLWFDAPAARNFNFRINNANIFTISNSEINTNSKKITGLPTSNASGPDAISAQQAINDLGTKLSRISAPANGAINLTCTSLNETFHVNCGSVTAGTATISISGLKNGGKIWILIYNANSALGFQFGSNFKNIQGGSYTLSSTGNVTFVGDSDGTNLYIL